VTTQIEEWKQEWQKVIQLKRTETRSFREKERSERTTVTVTVSVAKEFQSEAPKILSIFKELLEKRVV
jgi:hypothetical protein